MNISGSFEPDKMEPETLNCKQYIHKYSILQFELHANENVGANVAYPSPASHLDWINIKNFFKIWNFFLKGLLMNLIKKIHG